MYGTCAQNGTRHSQLSHILIPFARPLSLHCAQHVYVHTYLTAYRLYMYYSSSSSSSSSSYSSSIWSSGTLEVNVSDVMQSSLTPNSVAPVPQQERNTMTVICLTMHRCLGANGLKYVRKGKAIQQ